MSHASNRLRVLNSSSGTSTARNNPSTNGGKNEPDADTDRTTPASGFSLWTIVSILALCGSIAGIVIAVGGRPKIAFVRSADLINGYKGMKDAEKSFKAKEQAWHSELDTLEADYRRTLSVFNAEYQTLDKAERDRRVDLLKKQEENIREYASSLQEQAQRENTELTRGVLDRINAVAIQFGKENGYDLIVGTTQSGSVLYGADALDVTSQLLQSLNSTYEPGQRDTTVAR